MINQFKIVAIVSMICCLLIGCNNSHQTQDDLDKSQRAKERIERKILQDKFQKEYDAYIPIPTDGQETLRVLRGLVFNQKCNNSRVSLAHILETKHTFEEYLQKIDSTVEDCQSGQNYINNLAARTSCAQQIVHLQKAYIAEAITLVQYEKGWTILNKDFLIKIKVRKCKSSRNRKV